MIIEVMKKDLTGQSCNDKRIIINLYIFFLFV